MTFIGPKPIVAEPDYLTPFRAKNDRVFDARGNHVATANTVMAEYEDDGEMAQAIADALNEKFGPKPAESTETNTIEVVVYPLNGAGNGYDRWLVVDGAAYFQDHFGEVHRSIWTPDELEDGSAGQETADGVAVADIDPAILEGVTGTR